MAQGSQKLKMLPTVQEIEPSKIFCNAIVEERPESRPDGITAIKGAGIWLLDKDMTVLWMNDVMEDIYGPLSKSQGKNCFSAFRGRKSKCPDCLPTKAFESGNIVSGYISRTTSDDVKRFYQLVEAPMMDENNQVSRVLEIVLDVTEKTRIEQSLQQSEREYRALFEHAGIAVVVTNRQGIIVKVNRAFEELTGAKRGEMEGKVHYLEFVHPSDRTRISEYTSNRFVEPGRIPDVYEFLMMTRKGQERLIQISVSTMPDGNQIASMTDISETRKLEQEVRSKDQFLANILRHSVDAIVAMDPSGIIHSWNNGAELMFGYKAREILGKRFSTLFSSEFRRSRKMAKAIEQFYEQGFIRNFIADALTKDGRPLTIDITRTVIRDTVGRDFGSSAIIRDVTESRRSEQRLLQQEKMLALGEMAASLAHEVKNPLNSMVINMEVLKGHFASMEEPKRKAMTRYADVISTEITRLDKVMRGVLDFAKPIEVAFNPVDISKVLLEVIDLVSAQAKQSRIKIQCSVEEGLPHIEGSSDYLKQILLNLILNAFQAMPKGGSLKVQAERAKFHSVHISVTDTGVGIPRKDFNRVFELYFSSKEKGSGLGLPLVRRLVHAHGGTITFRSKMNHGTTFDISFPAA